MADVRRTMPTIAIGFAIVALLTSLVAVIVVMRRQPAAAPVAVKPTAARDDRTIDASEVLKLKRDVVEKVEANGTFLGVKVTDDALRTTFGLEPDDVITAINGRAIKREFDIFDAVLGMSTMNASIAYIEVTRGGSPRLLRWSIEGDLRTARRDPPGRRPNPYTGNPFTAPATPIDPLVDSIKKIDALHYEVPKATRDELLANPDAIARQARIVPAITNGRAIGFRLYAVRPGSLWSAIGLASGDVIRSVNGFDLTTPDKALEVYTKLKDATELQILVLRRTAVEDTIIVAIK